MVKCYEVRIEEHRAWGSGFRARGAYSLLFQLSVCCVGLWVNKAGVYIDIAGVPQVLSRPRILHLPPHCLIPGAGFV